MALLGKDKVGFEIKQIRVLASPFPAKIISICQILHHTQNFLQLQRARGICFLIHHEHLGAQKYGKRCERGNLSDISTAS